MAIQYKPNFFEAKNPYAERLDRLTLLNKANVDFIPINSRQTIDTSPIIETDDIFWEKRYSHAARILLTNPLCFAATRILQDTMSDAPLIVQEKQGNKWVAHENNDLHDFLEQPNSSMDNEELNVAYTTHIHTFGCIYIIMFQKGDVLPNGLVCQEDNQFEPIYPQRFYYDIRNGSKHYYFLPVGWQEWIEVKVENIFIDVLYNPIAHGIGVSLPSNPLRRIFRIHDLYLNQIESFFAAGAKPEYILSRSFDFTKEEIPEVPDEVIEEAVRRASNQSGRTGQTAFLGMAGNWKVDQIGSRLPELINKDLLHQLEILIKGCYGVPASIFWAGLSESNQRASRMQDSIDFYQDKIHRFQTRIAQRLGRWLVPKFVGNRKFRLQYDVSQMPLAQFTITKSYGMWERWYIRSIINRGQFYDKVNMSTEELTEAEKKEFYGGGHAGVVATGGTGDTGAVGGTGAASNNTAGS